MQLIVMASQPHSVDPSGALPSMFVEQHSVNWRLQRMERRSFSGHPPSAVANKEYGLDGNGLTIAYTPHQIQYAVCLIFPRSNMSGNHDYPLKVKFPKCFMFIKNYTLPEGLAIVYDGNIPLQFDHVGKDVPHIEDVPHFSLYCNKSMPEKEFLEKLNTVFSMPQVFPCRVHAGGKVEIGHILKYPPRFDPSIANIIDALEDYFDQSDHPMDCLDILALHTWIDSTTPTMDTLLEHPFYSRIAFHALGRCKEESISAEMRMTMIREQIGKHFGWNTRLRTA